MSLQRVVECNDIAVRSNRGRYYNEAELRTIKQRVRARRGIMGTERTNAHRRDMQDKIFDALMEVLGEKRYVDVSVGDICDKAFVSRPTFYRYFANKDNLVRWKTKQIFKAGLSQIGRTCTWKQGFYVTLVGLRRCKALYSDPQSADFVASFLDFASHYQRELLVEALLRHRGIPLNEKLEFEIDALVVVHGLMTRRWAEEGMRVPPETMADYLSAIVPYDLYHLLNEPEGDR